jgi:hypothetical protein
VQAVTHGPALLEKGLQTADLTMLAKGGPRLPVPE